MRRVRHLLPVEGPLDLALTFTCGQAFRWSPDGDGWTGVVRGAACRVVARAGALEVDVAGEDPGAAFLHRYFRLDDSPEAHLRRAPDAEVLRALPGFTALLGLRLLRQDPWETTISFICSAASNVRKIAAGVEGMAERWGAPIAGSARRAFPGPRALATATERDLRALGIGFRAPYVRAAARRIAEGTWDWGAIAAAPIAEARARLQELPGVGPKIADCVLLFGLDRLDTYPVDRWIRRATLELAARRRARDPELERWSHRLGPGRGYLQQLLFHLRRTGGPLPALEPRRPAASPRRRRAP